MTTKINFNQIKGAVGGVLNVKDYGAVGDGSANDTAAVNLWIAAINASTTPVACLAPGTYLCGPLDEITAANVISLYKDIQTNAWTASGAKRSEGQFWFEATS